ncbi:MAG: adenylosuccinate synthase [Candidatus Gracilibacteria bacterium]|jgi:adenylosuccinate synthase
MTLASKYGNVCAVLGGQWGDEGKGKLVDILAKEYEIVARGTGGANAGHTVYIPDPKNPTQKKKIVFHLIPSGILYPHIKEVIGNGCVVHIPTLFEEIEVLKQNDIQVEGRLFLSDRAHLVFEYTKLVDKIQEERKGSGKVGTTGRGIGPAYSDKINRIGLRVHELLDMVTFEKKFRARIENLQKMYPELQYDFEAEIEYYKKIVDQIKPLIIDSASYLNEQIAQGKKILLEGANAALLDIDHGTYPYVTSSNATIGGLVAGVGISALKMTSAIGVMKAYCTRVGSGPFPTELDNEIGNKLRETGGEYGSTTGRPRRCGWFDAVASKYSVMLNGYTCINLTKLDVMDDLDTVKIATKYLHKGKELTAFPASIEILSEVEAVYEEMPGWKQSISEARTINDLPENARNYVKRLQEVLGCPIEFVGVGIGREQMALS